MGAYIVINKYYKRYAYDTNKIIENITNTRIKRRIWRLTGKLRMPRDIIEEEIFSKSDYEYIKSIPDYICKNK